MDAQPQQKPRQDEKEFDEEAFLLEGAPDTIVCPISKVLMMEACVAFQPHCKPIPEIPKPNQNIRTQVVEWIERSTSNGGPCLQVRLLLSGVR